MITWRLHRKGAILVCIGAVLMGFLMFAAGYLTAIRRLAPPAAITSAIPAAEPASKKDTKEKQESAEKPHIEDEAFTLRVGAFADEADAKAFVQEMTARGHKPVVAPVAQNGIVLHMVLIGRYAGRDAAAAAAAELKRKEGISSAVVPAAPAG
ncbi:MAG TPA: SPOR domain-containing protein [Thermoanaerobaculia bacterium]|nr:SPOR domain-containing protein [Thermoanaerobaculia bacterium]